MTVLRRSNRRYRSGYGFRQVAIVLGVGITLTAGLFAGGYAIERQDISGIAKMNGSGPGGDAKVASAASADGVYSGSILYLPAEGSNCRQVHFDNRNGRFTDHGYVDCAEASAQSSIGAPKQLSAARAKVISMGFRDH